MSGSTYERPNKLFTPGPVNIPNRVSLASISVCYHHRVQAFAELLGETLEMLKPVFGTTRQVYPVHTTGRGAMEGVINNILTREDRVIAVCNGSFGAMAAKILERNSIPCVRCFEGWEDSVDLGTLEKLIQDVTKQMKKAAAELNFEAAAELRDKMVELKKLLKE